MTDKYRWSRRQRERFPSACVSELFVSFSFALLGQIYFFLFLEYLHLLVASDLPTARLRARAGGWKRKREGERSSPPSIYAFLDALETVHACVL